MTEFALTTRTAAAAMSVLGRRIFEHRRDAPPCDFTAEREADVALLDLAESGNIERLVKGDAQVVATVLIRLANFAISAEEAPDDVIAIVPSPDARVILKATVSWIVARPKMRPSLRH